MPELTWQAVIVAFVVSAIVAASYPYIVLKLGFGFNASLLSAFLGAVLLHVVAARTRGRNRLMNNLVQTAGTSATSTAFMAVVAAAFDYLNMNQSVDVHVDINRWEMFVWLILGGAIGVLFIPLFRRYFLEDPKLVFADGVSAAETIKVLDASDESTNRKLWVLGGAAGASGLISFLYGGLQLWSPLYIVRRFQIGIDWSLLSFGTGLLVGPRVAISTFLGAMFMLVAGPTIMEQDGLDIVNSGIAEENIARCDTYADPSVPIDDPEFFAANCGMMAEYRSDNDFSLLLLWTMWPATTLILSAGLTAVALQWRSIAEMFRTLRARGPRGDSEDISPRTTVIGVSVLAILLAYVQNRNFGMSYVETLFAVAVELPLILIGVRILGETNNGPVSIMANSLQALFAIFWPQNTAHNLMAAGVAGSGNAQAEGTIQDFRTGQLVGSTPRVLTYVQLCAVPIGAAAVSLMYPLLVEHYGLGPGGLTAPTGLKMANMAVLLTKGWSALPGGALQAAAVAAVLGSVLAVLSARRDWVWLPSAAGLGFGLILPGVLTIPMAIGAILGWVWERRSPGTFRDYRFTLAAGLVAGDALVSGVILPILASLGVIDL
jgi:uncharacterized oligopeptide transporter (OPT) family protein